MFFEMRPIPTTFRYVTAKTWNNIPDNVKTVDSLSLFRKGLKHFYLDSRIVARRPLLRAQE